MKKINIVLIIFFISILIPLNVNAKGTLRDEKNELAEMKSKAETNNRLTNESKAQIDAKRNAIIKANNTISENEVKVESAKTKVAESQEEVKVKTEEMKDIINMIQYTNFNSGEVYFDYIFSSDSITDMIERQAVITQIVDFTQEQLDDLNGLIKKNEDLQVKLANDNINLTNSISSYEKQVEELEAYIEKLASIGMDYQEQIKAKEKIIKTYQDAGCKDDDKIDDCYNKKFSISSTNFNRPMKSGKITQAWGNNGHAGMDIGGNPKGTAIYSPANGIVTATSYKNSCGGNIIYIRHQVNGQKYTSEYGHLTAINVKVGQQVTPSTVIGTVGGDRSTFYYDKCTTGTHLHYSISYGWYLVDYKSWSTFKSNTKATNVYNITHIKNSKGWSWKTRY